MAVDLSEILSMRHGISAALLGVLILLPATPASAQSRNDFEYWDTSGNGDLTCAEAEDRDEGLRVPAYRDNRDGTGIIYEWLERSRSSDGNNDGVACDSASNPNGYIPNAQVEPPVEPQACSADAETWHGLQVCDERPRGGYDRDAFGTGYSNLEDDIIAAFAAHDESDRAGLHPLLVPRVRHHGGRDCGDGHRAHRGAGGDARQRYRRRAAPRHCQ